MLRLVFMVCMIDAPDLCEQREMFVQDAMPVMACAMGAMPELAIWRETHPNWRIARWWCEDGRTVRNSVRDEVQSPGVPASAGVAVARAH
jgi:hypothetical protein